MSQVQWSLREAKNRFGSVVEAARRGEPQTVTRRGIPAVVVISTEEYERLQRLQTRELPSFTDQLLALPVDDGEFDRIIISPRELAL